MNKGFIFRRKTVSEHSEGFTLIELIVTVAIIGILSAVGLVSYQIVFKNTRDNKRSSDLKFIQAALEQYRGDQFNYPLNNSGTCTNGTFGVNCPLKDSTGNKTYLNNVPSDPTTSNPQYCYQPQSSAGGTCDNSATPCVKYLLNAKLENPPSGSPSYTCNSTTYNSQVGPP